MVACSSMSSQWLIIDNALKRVPVCVMTYEKISMEVTVFVRQPNASEYSMLGEKNFMTVPGVDEYISAEWEGSKKYFQVTAVHHSDDGNTIEVYAMQSDPPWVPKKGRTI